MSPAQDMVFFTNLKFTPSTVLKIAIKLCISIALIALLIGHSDISALRTAFEKIGWQQLVTSSLILLAATPLLAWRWHKIAHTIGLPISFPVASVIVLIGTFFNQLLPSAVGGDAMRVWLLKRENVPLLKGFSSILLDRVVALIGMTLIVVIGYPVLAHVTSLPTLLAAVAVVLAASISGVGLLLTFDKVSKSRVFQRIPQLPKFASISVDARAVILKPGTITTTLIASTLIHLMVSISVWILSNGIGLHVSLGFFFLLLPLVLLVSLLPISFAGWGVREGAMVTCLGFLGVDAAPAMAISILFGLAYILAGIPGCIAWLILRETQQGH